MKNGRYQDCRIKHLVRKLRRLDDYLDDWTFSQVSRQFGYNLASDLAAAAADLEADLFNDLLQRRCFGGVGETGAKGDGGRDDQDDGTSSRIFS